ncbi:hypothetical protein RND81_07G113800 [Saponaria officinalis]|uniref:Photosystem II reaction center X protein n=1 Tax=Saponaria officinalis TaxID=3572 RepID=A0AAW1JTY7_SAPOF
MASKSLISAVTMGSSSGNKSTIVRPIAVKLEESTLTVKGRGQGQRPKGLKLEAPAAAGLTVAMMVPQAAEAAELVPSLNNFLFSILAGGAVLTAIFGAVIAVSNFDPVKRA